MSFYHFFNSSLPQDLSIEELKDLVKTKPYINEYKILLAQKTNDPVFRDKAMAGINLLQNFTEISNISAIVERNTVNDFENKYKDLTGEEHLTDWVEDNIELANMDNSNQNASSSITHNINEEASIGEIYDTKIAHVDSEIPLEKIIPSEDDLMDEVKIEEDIQAPLQINQNETISPSDESLDVNTTKSTSSQPKQSFEDDDSVHSDELPSSNNPKELFETNKEESQSVLITENVKSNEKKSKKKVKIKDLKFVNTELGDSDDFDAWLMELAPIKGSNIDKVKKYQKKNKKSKVEIIAEHSIEKSEEIISEGLANILVKQGHIEDAISMYHKLILKFPIKSAYFALQIEKLKNLQ